MMSAAKGERRLLIVDTDAGIDDAMALCMAFHAHRRGEVEVGRGCQLSSHLSASSGQPSSPEVSEILTTRSHFL